MSILTVRRVHLCWRAGWCSFDNKKFEEARQICAFFFFLFFSDALSLSLPSLRLSVSLFFESVSRWKKKEKKARIFVQRRVENIVKTRARVSLGAFQPLFCFKKEYFYAINDRNRYENVRAVSIQGQFARLIFPLFLLLFLLLKCPLRCDWMIVNSNIQRSRKEIFGRRKHQ